MNNAIQTNNNVSIHKTLKFLKLFTRYRILDDVSSLKKTYTLNWNHQTESDRFTRQYSIPKRN